jgi:hypothetical protein
MSISLLDELWMIQLYSMISAFAGMSSQYSNFSMTVISEYLEHERIDLYCLTCILANSNLLVNGSINAGAIAFPDEYLAFD